MVMKTCCFCFDLKHGSNASATFILVTRIIVIILASVYLGIHDHARDGNLPIDVDAYFGGMIGECALQVLVSILLIIAVQKNIKSLFWPWMIVMGLEIAGGAVLIILTISQILSSSLTLLLLLFNVYMLACVIIYYKSLSAQNTGFVIVTPAADVSGEKQQPLSGNQYTHEVRKGDSRGFV